MFPLYIVFLVEEAFCTLSYSNGFAHHRQPWAVMGKHPSASSSSAAGMLTIRRESEVCISHITEVPNTRVKHKERDTSS